MGQTAVRAAPREAAATPPAAVRRADPQPRQGGVSVTGVPSLSLGDAAKPRSPHSSTTVEGGPGRARSPVEVLAPGHWAVHGPPAASRPVAPPSPSTAAQLEALRFRRAGRDGCRLRIVHIADVYNMTALPKLRSFVDSARRAAAEAGAGFVATFGGDWVSPYPLAQLDSGAGMTECLRMCGMTHCCLGNHEADIDLPELAARLREWQQGGGVVLNSNLPGLDDVLGVETLRADTLTLRSESGTHTRTVDLLGAVTIMQPQYVDGYDFGGTMRAGDARTPNDAVLRALRATAADLVVPLTHQEMPNDLRLAAECAAHPEVLCVLGGHDHDAVISTIGGGGSGECVLAKSGYDATTPLVVDVEWEGPGAPPRLCRTEMIAVDAWKEDAAVRAAVERHLGKLAVFEHALLLPPLLCPPALASHGIRKQQTVLGGLLCDTIKDVLRSDVALLEGGCVRAEKAYKANGVTVADLRAELPWDTEMAVVRMRGRFLAHAVAASRALHPKENAGWLQHDTALACSPPIPDGSGACVITSVAGAPFDDDKEYTVAAIWQSVVKGMDDNAGFRAWRVDEAAHGRPLPAVDQCPCAKQLIRVAAARLVWRALPRFEDLAAGGAALGRDDVLAAWIPLFGHVPRSPPVVARMKQGPPAAALQELRERDGARLAVARLVEASDIDMDGVVGRADYDAVCAGEIPTSHLIALQERSPLG